ncbi:MAG: hypothetical protein IT385_19635 [Deltaproteobacteria bacterium]|nr:hypothetical protein [Deltaproteobacteria bacterium]
MTMARALAVLALAHAACPSASFDEHGPRALGASTPGATALPRPVLVLEPAAAFEDEARRVEILSVSSGSGTIEVALRLHGDDAAPTSDERARLVYRIGRDLVLPLDVGATYWLRASAQRGGAGLLVWRAEAEPRLVAALSIDRGLADDVVPGLTVLPTPVGDPVYSEVRTTASGCVTALDHQSLRVRAAATTIDIPAGARRRVEPSADRAWEVVALDASRPTPGLGQTDAQRCGGGAHISWLALAVSPVSAVVPEP